ncbi:phosphatidate cytidylyltransferase [Alkaliphilus transvaalensis]|uniref:phosphatidate cytidylyltransferase n=1 Tax=Alkaliphilus transvaalensis TaxID=114628 RepID=UPI00047C6277|nr:phosphatidate cytidylyltransferase [Alkaliphilus transvaalensis]
MLKRIISAIVGIPFLLAIVHYGGVVLYLSVMIVSLIGLHEFYNAVKHKDVNPISWVGFIATIGILSQFYFSFNQSLLLFILVVATLVLSIIPLTQQKYNIIDISTTIYGIIYVSILLGHVILISRQENNIAIWLIFITAWGTDTFAYFAGNFFGKHKLCPNISPKKTIEGSIGGTLGAVLASGVFGYLFLREHLLVIIIMGFTASILAQIGDLCASSIKRYVGIKDFGNLMPGHGGALDRFDSILFTAPVVYYFLIFMINNVH